MWTTTPMPANLNSSLNRMTMCTLDVSALHVLACFVNTINMLPFSATACWDNIEHGQLRSFISKSSSSPISGVGPSTLMIVLMCSSKSYFIDTKQASRCGLSTYGLPALLSHHKFHITVVVCTCRGALGPCLHRCSG